MSPVILDQQEIGAGANLSGKFTLKNISGSAVSDLRYKLRLFEKPVINEKEGYIDNTPRIPINTVIAPETISVASGAEKTVKFQYSVPQNLNSDDYLFVVELFRGSGDMLDWQSAKIKVTGGSAEYIRISDVSFLANGQPAESPIAGISVTPNDKIEASFTAENNTNLREAGIKTTVYYRDTLSEKLKEEIQPHTLNAGKNKVKIALPKMKKPGGSYLAKIQIVDTATNNPVSNEVYVRWVIKGISAEILSVALADYSISGVKNQTLPVNVSYAGPADESDGGNGELVVKLEGDGAIIVSSSQDIKLSDIETVTAEIDLSGKEIDDIPQKLSIGASIVKDGKTLDSYSIEINQADVAKYLQVGGGTEGQLAKVKGVLGRVSLGYLIGIILTGIALIAVAVAVIKRKRNKQNAGPLVILVLIFSALFGTLIFSGGISRGQPANPATIDYQNPSYPYYTNKYLSAVYDGYSIYTTVEGAQSTHCFMTDEPITWHDPYNYGRLISDRETVNWADFYRGDHLSGSKVSFYVLTPSEGSKGVFTGSKRYFYVYHEASSYAGSNTSIYAIAHVELSAPSFNHQISAFRFIGISGSLAQMATQVTRWLSPLINSSYTAGSTGSGITYKGLLTNFKCNNASSAYVKNYRFLISQDKMNFNVVPFSNSLGVVDPFSLSSTNYVDIGTLPASSSSDYLNYDVTFTSFPVAGTAGTLPGAWASPTLYAYMTTYGPLSSDYDQITTIASVPIGYTAPLSTLSLTKSGAGAGTVTSTPAGINCDSSCSSASAAFNQGTSVTLSAGAAVGSTFSGWSGACAGSGSSCAVLMDNNKSVDAKFNTCVPDGAYTCVKSLSDCTGQPCGTIGTAICLDSCGQTVNTSLCSNCDPVICPACSSDKWREVAP